MRTIRSVHIQQAEQRMPVRFPRLARLMGGNSSAGFAQVLADQDGFRSVLHAIVEDFSNSRTDGAMVDAALAIVAVNMLELGLGISRPAVFCWRGSDEMLFLRVSSDPMPKSSPQLGERISWTEEGGEASTKVQLIVEGDTQDILDAATGKVEVIPDDLFLGEGDSLSPEELSGLAMTDVWRQGLLQMSTRGMDGMDAMVLSAAALYLWGRMRMVGMQEANIEHSGIKVEDLHRGGAHLQLQRFARPKAETQGFSLTN